MAGATIAYVTAGSVGVGHLARAFGLSRALERAGFQEKLVVVGPEAAHTFGLDHRAVTLSPRELVDPVLAPKSALFRVLSEIRPALVLVDLFWAPLVHVLPALGVRAWLLVRRVPRAWFLGPKGLSFSRAPYERVIAIEPGVEGPTDDTVPPIVTVNPEEVLPRQALRERLRVADDQKLVVIAQAGVSGECEKLLREEQRRDPSAIIAAFSVGATGPDVYDGAELFPLARWLSGADAIVTGAGYNAFWEGQWLGTAVRTRFVAFERPIDDQAWRIHTYSSHVPRENGADVLARRIVGM